MADGLRNEEKIRKQVEYWKNKGLHISQKNEFTRLFARSEAGAIKSIKYVDLDLSNDVMSKLLKVSNGSDISLYIILSTVLKGVIGRYTGEPIVSHLSPIYQSSANSDNKGLVIIQDKLLSYGSFVENVGRTKKTVVEAYSNQEHFSFSKLLGDFSSEKLHEIFSNQVLCLLSNIHEKPEKLEEYAMSFVFTRTHEGITGRLTYRSDKFKQDLVEAFIKHFEHYIISTCSDFKQPLNQIDIIPSTTLDFIKHCSNGSSKGFKAICLHQLFEEQVNTTPDQIAILYEDTLLTYAQLNQKANVLARILVDKGVKQKDNVILRFSRSSEMIVSILAVLKAGATFVPVNILEPTDRFESIISEISPTFYLTNVNEQIDGVSGLIVSEELLSFKSNDLDTNLNLNVHYDMPAYVIFTSGSTGIPKGVVLNHKGIVNTTLWRRNEYGFTTEDRSLLVFDYNFDGFILNLFTPLLSGSLIVIPNDKASKTPSELSRFIHKYKITNMTIVPALYDAILRDSKKEQLISLQRVTLAADVIDRSTVMMSEELNKEIILSNEYGPTENSVLSTYKKSIDLSIIDDIGRPIDNVNVRILGQDEKEVPIGVYGELCLAGVGLAMEYLNNRVMTEEKFKVWQDERLYFTGDIARWLPNGNIEFRGRKDNQVKFNGYRIELDEIRRALVSFHAVTDAVAMIHGDGESAQLLACIESSKEFDEIELRSWIKNIVPHYMIPQCIISVERLPRTSSGKVDSKVIKELIKSKVDYVEIAEPRNNIELILVQVWKKILKLEKVGVNQNFFSIGGHSLKATALLSEIYKEFGVDLSLNQIFITSTISELALIIRDSLSNHQGDQISRIPKSSYYPITSSQERILILDTIEDLGMSYHIPIAFCVEGNIDIDKLSNTVKIMMERHESLRTSFDYISDSPVQIVNEDIVIPLNVIQITENVDVDEEFLLKELKAFRLTDAPLFQVYLLNCNGQNSYLMFDFHHIIIDESSLAIFLEEFSTIYNGKILKEIDLTYKDFSVWQRRLQNTDQYNKDTAFWVDKLSTIDLSPLELPYDYKRATRKSFTGQRVLLPLPDDLFNAINKICSLTKTTHFMFFLASITILLHKYSQRKEIVIGNVVSGRSHSVTRELIGLFLNTIPMLNEVDGQVKFSDFLEKVKENALNDLSHSHVEFDDIVKAVNPEKHLNLNPIFNVMLAVIDENSTTNLDLEELSSKNLFIHNKTSKFDMVFEVYSSQESLTLSFEYATSLFKKETVRNMANSFEMLLRNITNNIDDLIQNLELLSDDSKVELLEFSRLHDLDEFNVNDTIIAMFEHQVQDSPDMIAIKQDGRTLTYSQLNKEANRLAHEITKHINHEDIVAIMYENSIEAIISILAVQKAGGAYLPIDINTPISRVEQILADSQAKVLLANNLTSEKISFKNICIDMDHELIKNNSDKNMDSKLGADSLAYVLYTSGTTGNPKGVMINHSNVVNLISNMGESYKVDANDKWALTHTYCFDVSVWEMYGALLNGGRLIIIPDQVKKSPKSFYELIVEEGITILCNTPSLFSILAEEMLDNPMISQLRAIILAGENLKPSKFKDWFFRFKDIDLINMYGITETTVYSTFKKITEYEIQHNLSDIGTPITNNYIYVLDKNLNLCPKGVHGEIYIGGYGVGRGYLNNDEMTKSKFIKDPFKQNSRLYKTGDVGRWLSNGDLEYLHRIDNQIKIRGYRIEVEEIEQVLLKRETLSEICVTGKYIGENLQLVAYFTSKITEDLEDLMEHVKKRLPSYMIPSHFIQLAEFPLNRSGKVDKAGLLDPVFAQELTAIEDREINPTEKMLLDIIENILTISQDQIGLNDSFFNLGGDSITAMQLVRRLNSYDFDIEVVDVFERKTIRSIALYLDECSRNSSFKEVEPKVSDLNPSVGCIQNCDPRVVHDIQPFNEVFYIDCYYQALIPVIDYFGGNYHALFANRSSLYQTSNRDSVNFQVDYITEMEDDAFLDSLGIEKKEVVESNDIINELIASLNKGSLAIVNIDCYYVARKKSLFNQSHWSHSILVHGYDQENREFYIVDNQEIQSMSYGKNIISFAELLKAYKGYNEFYNSNGMQKSVFFFNKLDREANYADHENVKTFTINNMKNMRKKFINSSKVLDKIVSGFGNIVHDENQLFERINQLNFVFGDLLTAKRIDLYKSQKILADPQLERILSSIVEHYEYICNVMRKLEITKRFNEKSSINLHYKLKQIVNLELEYLSNIEKI